MFSNTRSVEIEFGDCDPAGIVFYPNYFRMFDASTAHLFEAALGMKKIVWLNTFDIVGIPMVDTGAKFIKPSRFGDVVRIVTTITELRRSSFMVSHQLFNGDDLAIEAHEIRVWAGVDPDQPGRIKGQALPPRVLEALSGN
ncbi:MAG: acyl-CoA thioesterase [Alphaproteobacteria bacterium]|nr:acyl-CoA thioesterase [Alphaproteobacteria bacterium]